jgi:hypothetical protein
MERSKLSISYGTRSLLLLVLYLCSARFSENISLAADSGSTLNPPRFTIRDLPFIFTTHAPVAQLDRVPDYESGGRMFESCRVHH